jgi:hypothetical protein
VADRRLPRPKFSASRGVGVPYSRPSLRGRHGVVGASIGLEKALELFGARQCESIFTDGPQNAIVAAMGAPVEMLLEWFKLIYD